MMFVMLHRDFSFTTSPIDPTGHIDALKILDNAIALAARASPSIRS